MNDEPLHHPIEPAPKRRWLSTMPVGVLTTLTAVLVATGSATAWWTWQTLSTRKAVIQPADTESVMPATGEAESPDTEQVPVVTQFPAQGETRPAEETTPEAEMRSVSIYWVKDTGTHLDVVPTAISLEADQPPEELLQASFEHLLEGPEATDVASTIPPETQVNSLEIRSDGVHVDLSPAFTAGGGSASMMGRLGQVVYTATTLDPNANVWISVDGEPLEVLGGEGLIVSQPMTRETFDENFSL